MRGKGTKLGEGEGTKLGEDPKNSPKIFQDCFVRDNYVWDCYILDNYMVPTLLTCKIG